jgi:hypothetical protein
MSFSTSGVKSDTTPSIPYNENMALNPAYGYGLPSNLVELWKLARLPSLRRELEIEDVEGGEGGRRLGKGVVLRGGDVDACGRGRRREEMKRIDSTKSGGLAMLSLINFLLGIQFILFPEMMEQAA